MRARARFIFAAALAVVVTCGLVAAFFLSEKGNLYREMERVERSPLENPVSGSVPMAAVEPTAPLTENSEREEAVPPQRDEQSQEASGEIPVEEVLAKSGEDPGAVFYMSRVREALREGNPRFARELLRQMKEAHRESVLVKVAEDLFTE